MFKKRRPKGTLRVKKTMHEETGTDNEEEAKMEAEQLELIREMRSEQRDRRRARGVESNTLLEASEEAARAKKLKQEEEERGLQEESAGPDMNAIMTNQFTQQVGTSTGDDEIHERRMQAFLDEQMGVSKTNESVIEKKTTNSEEDELYAIPETLKSNDKTAEGLSGNAAPMFMGTGIAEVALPVEFKLKNIQKTEEAKLHLESKRESGFRRRDRTVDKRKNHYIV